MFRKSLLIGFPIIIILLVVYYQLGGFNKVKVQVVDTQEYIIAGKTYQGTFKRDSLKDYFLQMKKYAEKERIEGSISVVNYDFDGASTDSVHQFFGILVREFPFKLPEDIQVDTIYAQKVVRAIVNAHPIVRPSADQVMIKIKKYAEENALSIKDYSIEQYVEDDEIWVDVPLSNDAH